MEPAGSAAGDANGRALEISSSKKGIVWDEHNLAENEKIKAELNPIKCTEPKTPYQQPLSDTELDDLEPLSLDGETPEPPEPECAQKTTEKVDGAVACSSKDDDQMVQKDPDADPEEEEVKHKAFEAHRKAHYNMREAMLKARQDMEDEED